MLKVLIGGLVGAAAGYGAYRYARAQEDNCFTATYKKIPGTEMTLPGTPTPEQVGAMCAQQSSMSFLADSANVTMGGFALMGALAGYALK